MKSLSITFTVDRTPDEAFAAIRDVRAWWGAGIEGSTDRIGDEFRYRHEEIHTSTQKLIELVPGEKIVWRITDARLTFTKDQDEWKGTQMRFELAKNGAQTEVRFTHDGLVPSFECYSECSKGWGYYVGESLKSLLTTGRGKPDPVSKARARDHAAG